MAAVIQKRSLFEIPQINHSALHIIQQQSQEMKVNLFILKGGMQGCCNEAENDSKGPVQAGGPAMSAKRVQIIIYIYIFLMILKKLYRDPRSKMT